MLSFELFEVEASGCDALNETYCAAEITQEVSDHVVALLEERGHVLMKCCVPKQCRRLLADLHREEKEKLRFVLNNWDRSCWLPLQ